MSDIEREIHYQPKECGNCGAFAVRDADGFEYFDCRCDELMDVDPAPAPWKTDAPCP